MAHFAVLCGRTGAKCTRQRAYRIWHVAVDFFPPRANMKQPQKQSVMMGSLKAYAQLRMRSKASGAVAFERVNHPRGAPGSQRLTKLLKIGSSFAARGVREVACSNIFQLLQKRQVVGRRKFFSLLVCAVCAVKPAMIREH